MRSPAKICVLTSAHPPFDVRIFHKECVSLANAGHEVILVAPHHGSEQRQGVSIDAVSKHTGRVRRMFVTTSSVLWRAFKNNADIYHFHDPELIPAGLVLRAIGKTVIYDIHEDLPGTISYKSYIPRWLRQPMAKAVDFLETRSASCFSALIAATPEIAARFRSHHPNVRVVHNYPLSYEFEAKADVSSIPESYVAYVGLRITIARGAKEMVRAMSLLPKSLPVKLKLVGNIDSPELLKDLSALPGWEKTEYVGTQDRVGVASILRGAIAGLVVLHPEPNYVASHPVKLFEYMCAGVPVVASNFSGFCAIVRDSGCGIVVDPLNEKEIASAIEYLVTHPTEAQEMGEKGRQAVRTRFNWKNEERTLLDVYQDLSGVVISRSNRVEEIT